MGSRLNEYRRLLQYLRGLGYRFLTMAEFATRTARDAERDALVCLLRVDVDSDPAGAARMFACDCEEGIRGTYYFRLTTLDPPLIRQIVSHGGEVGYHFEEIASFAKRFGITSREQIDANIDAIRNMFRQNLHQFHVRTDVSPRTVASHGDFVNRRIGLPNQHLLSRELMDELGIVADAYDPRIHASLAARFSDCPPPLWWRPENPFNALRGRPASISILVHPRQWRCNPVVNFGLGIVRLREEAVWRWRNAREALKRCRSAQTAMRA